MRRLIIALLVVVAAGYLSAVVSGRVAEDRVAGSIAANLRRQGVEPMVYVWPQAAPDTASILERNGVGTRLCTDTEGTSCYPAAYLYRSVPTGPFVAHVRWQYSRDQHGVGGTRRFFGLFGFVRELKPERSYIQ
jgi:hypothetical protein